MGRNNLGNTKIVKQIKKISKDDLKDFRKFLLSPYFNSNPSLVELYDFICKFQPDFESSKMTQAAAYQYLYPEKKFNYNGLKMLRNKLLEMFNQFIHHQSIKGASWSTENSLTMDLSLIRFYGNTGIYEEAIKIKHRNLVLPPLHEDYFIKQFLIEKEIHKIKTTQRRDSSLFQEISYKDVITALDKMYGIQKLVYLCQMLSHYSTLPLNEKITFEEEVIQLPKVEYLSEENIVYQVWMAALHFLKGDEAQFSIIKELLIKNAQLFSANGKRNLCGYLQNYVTRSDTFNRLEKFTRLFDLYKFQMKEKVFDDFNFTSNIFLNMTNISIALNRLDWFPDSVLGKAKEFKDGTFQILLAKKQINKGQFKEANQYLLEAEQLIGNIDSVIKQLKMALLLSLQHQIFFHENNNIVLDASIKKFRSFISRGQRFDDQLPLHLKQFFERNRNFNNLCGRINTFNHLANRKEKIRATNKLWEIFCSKENEVYQEHWLQSKLESLFPNPLREELIFYRGRLKSYLLHTNIVAFESMHNEFLDYLNTKKDELNLSYRISNKHFSEFLLEIQKFNGTSSISFLEELESRICRESLLIERVWLLNKVSELKESMLDG